MTTVNIVTAVNIVNAVNDGNFRAKQRGFLPVSPFTTFTAFTIFTVAERYARRYT